MFNRPRYIILILTVILVLGLFKLPSQTMARFKLALASLYLPLFGLSITAQGAAEKAGNAVLPRSDLIHQNEGLRLENQQLHLRITQAEEVWRENSRLRQLLDWRARSPWKLKLARVIGRDPANWWKTIRIDLGRRDGVNANNPVMNTNGLLGRVSASGDAWSQVILLGDPNLRVGAVVQEEGTRETGIVVAGLSSSALNNFVDLAYLSGSSSVKPGQPVYTSGDGGIFPPGILIGRVVDTHSDLGLATEARVQLAAKPDDLEEIWVLIP